MDPKLTTALKLAASLWAKAAEQQLRSHPEQLAELERCIISDACDVRIVYHTRANAITLETVEPSADGKLTAVELFRDQLFKDDTGFASLDTDTKQ
jgi:hypothetical protein